MTGKKESSQSPAKSGAKSEPKSKVNVSPTGAVYVSVKDLLNNESVREKLQQTEKYFKDKQS